MHDVVEVLRRSKNSTLGTRSGLRGEKRTEDKLNRSQTARPSWHAVCAQCREGTRPASGKNQWRQSATTKKEPSGIQTGPLLRAASAMAIRRRNFLPRKNSNSRLNKLPNDLYTGREKSQAPSRRAQPPLLQERLGPVGLPAYWPCCGSRVAAVTTGLSLPPPRPPRPRP